MSSSSLLQHKFNHPRSLNKMLFQSGAKQKEQNWNIYNREEKKAALITVDGILLLQTCSSLSPQLLLPQQHWKRKGGGGVEPSTPNRNQKAEISTWDAVHRQISFPTAVAGTEARNVPAGAGERLFPILLHCAKWGGSCQCSPPAGTPGQPQVSGRCWVASRALCDCTSPFPQPS